MATEADIHEGILSSNTYEDLVILMLLNPGHKMSSWMAKLYLSKLESITSSDGLPYVQPWLHRYCTGDIFFLTRKLTSSEKMIILLRNLLCEVGQSNTMRGTKDAANAIKSSGVVVPIDEKFPLAKLACVYNDKSAYE